MPVPDGKLQRLGQEVRRKLERAGRSSCFCAVFIVLAVIGLSGCGVLDPSLFIFTSTPALLPVITPAPTQTETAEAVNCVSVWSTRLLPDVSLELNQAFRQSGMSEIEAEASTYGEDCIDPDTHQVVRFLAMQTDFFFNVSTGQVDDPQVFGEWVEKIMRVLDSFSPGQVPGSNPGLVEISFSGGTQTTILRFRRSNAESLLQDGLKGSALYDALQAP